MIHDIVILWHGTKYNVPIFKVVKINNFYVRNICTNVTKLT